MKKMVNYSSVIELAEKDAKATLDKIRALIGQRGITQHHIAKSMKMSDGGFSRIMSGKTKLTLEVLFQIARILGVEPASLCPSDTESDDSKLTFEDYVDRLVEKKLQGRLRQ